MKTTTPEVLCDACKKPIPVMHPTAIFATLRGPEIGHKKLDFCEILCLFQWADIQCDAVEETDSEVVYMHDKDCKCNVCTDPFN